ncbi:recombination mediator RecR [Helcococcus ovis]|uniref:Recombination protein RecR n=1 Tax=Helcococcus ovis TaxID=72026 RepID=A0A4R9C2T2_9FIRM|nr:recombination mediator RecR [Helcococcus ovis]TFF66033.1 recombination protein RecR [Helcococcus ovis]TFF66975.1 recombination protein RecR [Helcococcus ovis]TFF68581.1 recombination protein RecR [Helcococcus ovis]WNZ01308.1 recombination mediator RecR [Helcococcus ovis]
MFEYPGPVEDLIENLRKLPSIGRKSAQRMALHIVNMEKESIESIIKSLENVKNNIKKCEICGNITENEVCDICSDNRRDDSVICVVEDVTNLLTIEKTNTYTGKYYVLNGLINPNYLIDTENINIDNLINYVNSGRIKEIIFAISPTVEGETTMLFIKELIKDKNIKITRIASGIPVGGNLEYFDEITLSKALEDRKTIK